MHMLLMLTEFLLEKSGSDGSHLTAYEGGVRTALAFCFNATSTFDDSPSESGGFLHLGAETP
jgi:hypothetical protein